MEQKATKLPPGESLTNSDLRFMSGFVSASETKGSRGAVNFSELTNPVHQTGIFNKMGIDFDNPIGLYQKLI